MSGMNYIQDFLPLELTARRVTDEGYLEVPGRLARTGVQNYYASEMGLDKSAGLDPMKIIRLYRPPEEVFDADSMASFEGKPITIEHPDDDVTADNWQKLAKGEVRGVQADGKYLKAMLCVKSKDAITAIMKGKVQLSNGYSYQLDMTPGTSPEGHEYDGIQRNIRGNHIALVDAARCGSACRIADLNPTNPGEPTMTTTVVKVTVDGIPLEVSETAAASITKLQKEKDDALAKAASAEAKLKDSVSKEVHDKALADIEQLKKDVITPAQRDAMVADWAKLLNDSKRLAKDVDTTGKTCLAIRKEVIAKVVEANATAKLAADAVLGGTPLDAADADLARRVFNVLVAMAPTEAADTNGGKTNDADQLGAALSGAKDGAQETPLVGRAAMMHRQLNLHKADVE